jgi:hypothetical protein
MKWWGSHSSTIWYIGKRSTAKANPLVLLLLVCFSDRVWSLLWPGWPKLWFLCTCLPRSWCYRSVPPYTASRHFQCQGLLNFPGRQIIILVLTGGCSLVSTSLSTKGTWVYVGICFGAEIGESRFLWIIAFVLWNLRHNYTHYP